MRKNQTFLHIIRANKITIGMLEKFHIVSSHITALNCLYENSYQSFSYGNKQGRTSIQIRFVNKQASMAECLCCLARSTKVLCTNLGATRHRIMAVCLGSSGRYILITCDIHRPLWLVSVYGEFKWLSAGNLRQAGFLSRATAINNKQFLLPNAQFPRDIASDIYEP